MRKAILIINLIVKTAVELIIVTVLILPIGIIFFAGAYLFYTIGNAVNDYKEQKEIN
tara:strand:- start:931 stop:1101 length:171 start_codon:yes stop_codon:yes gene_type:complete